MEDYNKRKDRFMALTSRKLNGIFKKPFPIEVFLTAPASTKYHGNYEGGLFDHSEATYDSLQSLTIGMGLKWERPESPLIVGLFHDLCKIDSYVKTPDGEYPYCHNEQNCIDGHGEKSVIYLQKYIDLTDEEIACIRWHMGAYEKDTGKWDYYDRAIRLCPNVLYTHTADMIASKIKGV